MKTRTLLLSAVLGVAAIAAHGPAADGAAARARQDEAVVRAHPVTLKPGADNVGILVFDDLFITELVAPLDTYKHAGDRMNVFTIGPTAGAVRTYEGVRLEPDFSIADAPRIDVLVVPSGGGSRGRDARNDALVGFIRERARSARYVTSHCWGAFLLAAAGLLDGREATTFPSSIVELGVRFPAVKVVAGKRFVESGNIVTSNGGLAAFEAALFIVEKMYGKTVADEVADGLVFAPENRRYSINPTIAASF